MHSRMHSKAAQAAEIARFGPTQFLVSKAEFVPQYPLVRSFGQSLGMAIGTYGHAWRHAHDPVDNPCVNTTGQYSPGQHR